MAKVIYRKSGRRTVYPLLLCAALLLFGFSLVNLFWPKRKLIELENRNAAQLKAPVLSDLLDGTWQPEGINFWEADVDYVAIYKGWYGQTVKADGSSTANMSAPERGKYVRPYEIVNGESNQMWNTGYKWCEAHYLSPISIVHFRNTALVI